MANKPGSKKGNKKGGQQPFFNNSKANVPTMPSADKITISADEKELYELFKETIKDMEPDREAIKQSWEELYSTEYAEKASNMEAELEKAKSEREKAFEEELKQKNESLLAENDRLEKDLDAAEKRLKDLEEKSDKISEKQEEIITVAQAKADAIIETAEEEAKKQNEEILREISAQKKELDEREEKIEDDEIDLDARKMAIESKERRLSKMAEVYDQANPDAVAVLERNLKMRAEQLEAVQKEYEDCQAELNKIRLQQIKHEGISAEELQSTNDALRKRVEELENKCNRYTEYELSEMKRALDQEESYLVQIKNLNNEVAERKNEVVRLSNSIMEFEQLKAQLDMLRTLNDHLRSELDNTKRMLESSVGEICPALTSIDIDENAENGTSYSRYNERLNNRRRVDSLNKLVQYVRVYAASQEKPLYYSEEDMCAFVAGLASSPLAILQGMSGTGKTSLPKVFCDALMGEICVVPVESSWRDRNELLGYYNDFSKKFTAKEFTCDLYRASCSRYAETIYFIVLDEMNLSRVEYYFADFLSVLEDKKDKWLIKLVDTDMRQLPTEITEEVKKALKADKNDEADELLEVIERLYPNNKLDEDDNVSVSANDKQRLIAYLSNRQFKNKNNTRNLVGGPQNLIDGNTIKIPRNVWFIGTANRDESTFEITDKVYDRAQVLNFNERAKGTKVDREVPSVFVTYDDLQGLFRDAMRKKTYTFNAEENETLQKVESILKKYFRISYGNRIQDQMNSFVPVYVEARRSDTSSPAQIKVFENEAIDYQLTNKVLRKLEYEDIKKDQADDLRKVFEQYGLKHAKEFLRWKTDGNEG